MRTLLKVLLGLLIALPMTAYVVGSLAASSREHPSRLEPVVITEAPASPRPPATAPSRAPEPERSPGDGGDVRVLTPQPTQLDDDLDDDLDDGPDDDRDDDTDREGADSDED